MLGQRFAYDFLVVDRRRGMHPSPAGYVAVAADRRAALGDCYAWGAPDPRAIRLARSSEPWTGVSGAGLDPSRLREAAHAPLERPHVPTGTVAADPRKLRAPAWRPRSYAGSRPPGAGLGRCPAIGRRSAPATSSAASGIPATRPTRTCTFSSWTRPDPLPRTGHCRVRSASTRCCVMANGRGSRTAFLVAVSAYVRQPRREG